jgi:hypothetical protein
VSPVLAGHQEPRLPVVEGAHRQSCSVQSVRVSSNRAAMRAERVGGGHGTTLVLESEERLHHGDELSSKTRPDGAVIRDARGVTPVRTLTA